MAVYGRAELHDLGRAVERLPGPFRPTGPGSAAATGTDGRMVRRTGFRRRAAVRMPAPPALRELRPRSAPMPMKKARDGAAG